eukprot:2651821-Heterocapsa_arctica.AAC.1
MHKQITVTAEAAAASAATAATIALQSATAAPMWNRWRQAATQGRTRNWLDKKARRAQLHSDGIWGADTRSAQCSMCHRNQPGTWCDLQLCGPCCQWQRRKFNTGD